MAASLATLTPRMRSRVDELLTAARAQGLRPVVVSTRRTCAEQNAIYAQGRTTPGKVVTEVQGCRSWHIHGRAVDLDLGKATPEAWAQLGALGESLGLEWGGRWKPFVDLAHFQLTDGISLKTACPDPAVCTVLPDDLGGPSRAPVVVVAAVSLAAAGVGVWLSSRKNGAGAVHMP